MPQIWVTSRGVYASLRPWLRPTLPITSPRRQYLDTRNRRIAGFFEQNWSKARIGREFGIIPQSVLRVVKKLNLVPTRTCQGCHEPFIARGTERIFCSHDCYLKRSQRLTDRRAHEHLDASLGSYSRVHFGACLRCAILFCSRDPRMRFCCTDHTGVSTRRVAMPIVRRKNPTKAPRN